MTKYYVVELTYCGPNPHDAKHVDFNRFEITTKPPQNAIGEICWEGYLGTSNNVARYAHGVYDSLAAAEYALKTGPLLHQRFRRSPLDDFPYHVLAVYRPGRYAPASDDVLGQWLQWLEDSADISAYDTDTDLVRLAGDLRYELE